MSLKLAQNFFWASFKDLLDPMNFNVQFEPTGDRSYIFVNVKNALDYVIAIGLFSKTKTCCTDTKSMSIQKSKNHLNSVCFRCNICRKREPVFINLRISQPKIELHQYFICIYKWLELSFEKDVCRNIDISRLLYGGIKKKIWSYLEYEYEKSKTIKIGGPGIKVQVDETVICHGYLENCPSSLSDDTNGITWLLGIIEENSKNIKLIILKDRKIETFTEIFKTLLHEGTTVITDGHRSYPRAVNSINGEHIVVNHSLGFKNSEGFTTNNIENLWSIMKYEINRRRGVIKTAIPRFLHEFLFRYSNLRKRDNIEMRSCFKKILTYLFNK